VRFRFDGAGKGVDLLRTRPEIVAARSDSGDRGIHLAELDDL
jgi:hypothetical protein